MHESNWYGNTFRANIGTSMNFEKRTAIIVVILTLLLNAYILIHINEYAIDKNMHDKTAISLAFKANRKNISNEAFLNAIVDFSTKTKIEIAQYNYLNEDNIDIYTTQKENYSDLILITNYILKRHIRTHDFKSISNIGIKNILYVDSDNINDIKKLSNAINTYCNIYYDKSDFADKSPLFTYVLYYTDIMLLPILLVYIFSIAFVLLYSYSHLRKAYTIYKIFGYSSAQVFLKLNDFIHVPLFLTNIISNCIISVFLYKFIFCHLMLESFFSVAILDLVIQMILILLSIFLFSGILCNEFIGRKVYKIEVVTYTSKIILLLLFVVLCNKAITQREKLKCQYDSLASWNTTKKLYILGDTYLSKNFNNLALEDKYNAKVYQIYKDLSDSGEVFLMDTLNYEHSTPSTDNENDYNYFNDAESEKDLYSYEGKNIMVDINYLSRHPVKTVTDKPAVKYLSNDINTLNILVPVKYKEYESSIKTSFLKWFYFANVEVPNMYREARKQPLIKKDISNLKVNIVYIKNNQKHFTYSIYSGNHMNIIEDSIITVYTGNIDNSFLTACLGYCIYLQANDQYCALKEINTVANKYNVPELNTVSSVYDQKGEVIQKLSTDISDLTHSLIILALLLVIILTAISYEYNLKYLNEIIIKTLYGNSFLHTYKKLIGINLIINISILLTIAVFKKSLFYQNAVIILLFSVLDFVIASFMHYILYNRDIMQYVKGA